MKKVFTVALSSVLAFSMISASVVSAASPEKSISTQSITLKNGIGVITSVLFEDASKKIVKVIEGTNTIIVKYDKINGIFEVQENNLPSYSINTNNTTAKNYTNNLIGTFAYGDTIVSGSDEWWGSYYQVIDQEQYPRIWNVRIDDDSPIKSVEQKSSNYSDLDNFRKAVDSTKTNTISAAAALGVAGTSAIAAILTAPETAGIGTIVGLVVAAGGSISAGAFCWSAYSSHKDAKFYYSNINFGWD